ncbi:putative GTP-binding protein era [Quillaja saponaria]|uniref:GTP-binding protein era n=1 Tax=Quillaja saponaria TaxID=32244 RepID=A0AAD7L7S8_QUISA|nr:putative GTP-binding protein era [Quillaja saponaria]
MMELALQRPGSLPRETLLPSPLHHSCLTRFTRHPVRESQAQVTRPSRNRFFVVLSNTKQQQLWRKTRQEYRLCWTTTEAEELDYGSHPNHRSGYVAVLGKPNVGKSTLANQMIGQKLSIVTDKPQTTRHRILGICSGPDYQMILYDTPWLPQKIDEVLEEGSGSLKDRVPTLLIINKKDLIKPGEIAKKLEWYQKFTDVDEVIPVSAKYGHGVEDVKEWILSKLPNGPAYYPKDIVSEHPERFFVAEIVREKIFMQYRDEVPYACQVNVVSYKARPTAKDFIQVEVVVEKNSQKIILIGKDGKALKLLATAARLDIEDFLQKKVYLEVEVKVKENWRQDEGLLKYYGYGGQIRAL